MAEAIYAEAEWAGPGRICGGDVGGALERPFLARRVAKAKRTTDEDLR
jgi:hypothetical protein